jgi:type I restriction enzyme S subunit
VAGSAQPKFNKTEFRALKITQPDAATLRGFNQVYSDHEVMVSNNLAEIQTLITLRDSLLPRLISGKIKI